jgi:hypothetical protein
MSQSGRYSLVAALVLLLIAAVPIALFANHAWNDYHWARQSNPFTVKLGNNVSSVWTNSLANASSDWSRSTVLDTTVVAGGTRPKNCRPTSGRVEVCSSSYGNTGWLGVAQIWLTTGDHIVQGTVKLNDYYFNQAQYNTSAWRALVTCQEIGHTFGLDHQDTNFNNANLGTCMDYTNDPGTNQHPNQHDYDELGIIYSHVDSFTTIAQTTKLPAAMSAFDFDEPRQWGRLVKGSRQEGTAQYDLDFGHGNHIATYVTWAK